MTSLEGMSSVSFRILLVTDVIPLRDDIRKSLKAMSSGFLFLAFQYSLDVTQFVKRLQGG